MARASGRCATCTRRRQRRLGSAGLLRRRVRPRRSHPRVFAPPTPPLEALDSIDALLESPSARLLTPGPRYIALLREMVEASGASGNLVFDAQIAAVCLEHGARTLLTEDRDFARFPGITTQTLSTFTPS